MSQAAGRLTVGRLIVEFYQQADRVGHALLAVAGDRELLLAESVEGNTEQDWPPSPPLQQLSWETTPDGRRCALLVGMAGISHWSASVVADEAAIRFELACRAKQPPEVLGTTYASAEAAFDAGTEAALSTAHGRLTFRPAGNTRLCADGRRLSLSAIEVPNAIPATVCWGYDVRWDARSHNSV